MSNSVLCSDIHMGHKSIHKYRKFVRSPEENVELFLSDYDLWVKKDTCVYFLGDVVFDKIYFDVLKNLKGTKRLVKGNHDDFPLENYLGIFENIYGALFKYKFQFTHVPVHPDSLRGRINVHGHLHNDTVNIKQTGFEKLLRKPVKEDENYFNICPENLNRLGIGSPNGYLITLDELRSHLRNR